MVSAFCDDLHEPQKNPKVLVVKRKYFDLANECSFYVALFDFIPTICILLVLQQCIRQVNSVISTTCTNTAMYSIFCLLPDQPCKKCLLFL